MPNYLEFEVSLLNIEPRIWRRFLLRSSATFRQLHDAIQVAGPWQGFHLWQFDELGRAYHPIAGIPDDESETEIPDAKRAKVASYLERPGNRCLYRYDFGDDWEHEVAYVRLHELDESFQRRLRAGERAFPPEDCGGIPGYYECLAALGQYRYPKGEGGQGRGDLAERREWLGEWTPEWDLDTARQKFDR